MVLTSEKRQDIYASIAALSIVATGFGIGAAMDRNHIRRGALTGIGALLAGSASAIAYTLGEKAQKYGKCEDDSDYEKFREFHRADFKRFFLSLNPEVQAESFLAAMEGTDNLPELMPGEESGCPLYNWERIVFDLTCAVIAGNTGYGKSSVALWLLGMLTREKPAIITVFDPHASENNWEDYGLRTLADFGEIEEAIYEAEKELDLRRMDKSRPRTPMILVLDELGACMDNFKDKKRVARINRRIASEGRKFFMTGVVINQSDNCDAMGLDSKYKKNYTTIYVGELAREQFKRGTEERQILDATAYPCCVTGNVPARIAEHPTHGHHTEYQQRGKKPANLLPINQIKAMTPTAFGDNPQEINLKKSPQNEGKIPNLNPLEALERAYSIPIALSEAEEQLLLIAAEYGRIHGRDVMRALHLDSMEEVRGLFAKWEEMRIGRSYPTEKGSIEFRVIVEDDKK